jgi:hypothetical protein
MKTAVGLSLASTLFASAFAAELDNWEVTVPSSTYLTLLDVTYAQGVFVAVGERGGANLVGEILTSANGAAWTPQVSGIDGPLFGITYGATTFVAVGAQNSGRGDWVDGIVTSPDGRNWTRRVAGLTNVLFDVCYGNNTFVAVGGRGAAIASRDGVAWANRSLKTQDEYLGVTAGPLGFVTVGGTTDSHGVILSSPDGYQWTRRPLGGPRLWDAAYGNGQFVAVGEFDAVWRSTDGVTWVRSSAGVNDHLFAVSFMEGRFVGLGAYGRVTSSSDGVNWIVHRRGLELLYGVAHGNGRYVAVDYDGAILRTTISNRPPVAVAQVPSAADFFSTPPQYVIISPNGTDANVNLSAAGSYDPDGNPLSFVWLADRPDGSIVELARTQEAEVVLPLGQHNLSLRVSDSIDEGTQNLQIRVITASEAVGAVLALAEESLPERDKHVIVVLLRKAQRTFESGQIESGLHRLARLEKQIAVWLMNSDPDLAQSLIAAIAAIRTSFAEAAD